MNNIIKAIILITISITTVNAKEAIDANKIFTDLENATTLQFNNYIKGSKNYPISGTLKVHDVDRVDGVYYLMLKSENMKYFFNSVLIPINEKSAGMLQKKMRIKFEGTIIGIKKVLGIDIGVKATRIDIVD